MKTFLRSTLLLFAMAAPAFAATSTEFYMSLLRRGRAEVEAGRHADATTTLRLAAFGLLDSIEHYQTAQAYLAVASDRLGRTEQAREAARRILAAEKVEKKFRAIALPAPIRTAFDAVAKKVLSASDAAALSGGAVATATTATATTTAPPPIVDRIDVVTETRKPATPTTTPVEAPKPQPQPQTTQPQNTQPTRPQTTQPQPQTTQPQTTQPQNTQPTRPQATQPQPQTTQPQNTQPQNNQPQTTQPQNTQPAQPQTTQPPTTQPQTTQPPTTQPQTTQPQNTQPARPQATQPQTTQPRTTQPARPAPQRPVDVPGQFAAAERALIAGNINEARRIYRELLAVATLDHGQLIRVAEGLYRSRDFANVLIAFERAGALRSGEEPYRYYLAVAAYEVGQYDRARRELAAALPFIEVTPDVQRYRVRIEAAR